VIVIFFSTTLSNVKLFAQILYDNGPIFAPSIPPPNGFVTDGRAWDCRVVSFMFMNGTNDIVGDGERAPVRQAFQLWQQEAGLVFREVFNENEANIRISWVTFEHGDPCVCAFDGQNGTLAHGFFPPPNLDAFAGDIHFDDSEDWTIDTRNNSDQPIDLMTVAAHEIGHALGLNHTTVANSLMNASYNGSHRFLGQDDIDGIRSIYGLPMVILGVNLLCNANLNTFSVQNQPANSVITWSSSNPLALSFNPAMGNNTIPTRLNNFNGEVTITATLGGACGNVNFIRTIWVGTPVINSSFVSLNELDQCEHWMVLGANVTPSSNNGITRFHWTENDPIGNSTSIGEGTTMVADIYAPPLAGISRTVYAFASNACSSPIQLGSKEYEYRDWDTCTSPPPYGCGAFVCLTSFPNPTSNELTVSFKGNSDNIKENKTKKSKQSGTAQVRIFDENQKNWIFLSAKDNDELKISVSQLPKGTYYLDVTHSKGDHFRKRILIE
jgi:hypothetical protein